MAAYVIADLEITDPAGFKAYQQQAGATLELYGGKYIVRGGPHQTMEGDWRLHTLVVIEFESVEKAWQWYRSPEYAPLIDLRQQTATTQAIVVQGT
ncbi:MAG TPA: DUF1330 domain-containing protein [Ktedonobacterales bacterium]|jgi:uncharacterized protein (DUF1330 family)